MFRTFYLSLVLLGFTAFLPSHSCAQAVVRNGEIFELTLSGMAAEYAQEFHLQYTVGDDGEVAIPYIGTIKAAGLSTTQLSRTIEKRLVDEKIFTQPTAVISLQQNNRMVTVSGGVRAPQAIVWTNDLNLSQAIARAGGRNEFAGWKVKVVRGGEAKVYNFKNKDKDPSQNPRLLPGDEVEVPE